jgi:molecular chaperone DnaJ
MPAGDLLVHLVVADDPYFQRDGYDVHVEVPVTVGQAVLGGPIDVLTLDGMVELKLPAGTQPSAQLSMRGKGIRAVQGSGRGNQYVHVRLNVPRTLTDRQLELMQEFLEEEKKAEVTQEEKSGKSFVDNMNTAWGRLKNFLGAEKGTSGKKTSETG